MAKIAREYTLCRTATTNEYCKVIATSAADAKRKGWAARRVPIKSTKWHVVCDPLLMKI